MKVENKDENSCGLDTNKHVEEKGNLEVDFSTSSKFLDKDGLLELLNNLIHSTANSTIMIDKSILRDIQTCLLIAHEKIEFLQLES